MLNYVLDYVFVTNNLGSDNWVQLYCDGELIWESDLAWKYVEEVAEELADKDFARVEVEYITDEEMADY
jgi:hypothetical protein